MRFHKLDLNLLVALDALLRERSVTRAANRLHLTPSAVSNALARLREYFGDDLLVTIGRRMEPTPRAAALAEAVRDVLLRIESAVAAQPAFDPRSSDRVFRIFASDYTQVVLGPHLMALAAAEGFAGQIQFLAQVEYPYRDLERGEADLLIIPSEFLSHEHPSEVLWEEQFVCALWAGSKLAREELTLDRYLASGHIAMVPQGRDAESYEAWLMHRRGVRRRLVATTYSFAALPALVCGTEWIATIHMRLARRLAAAWPLVLRPVPVPLEPMRQSMQWHRYWHQDPGLVWLRGLAARGAEWTSECEAPPAAYNQSTDSRTRT
jgi:DNA-binding transcriptional LysR family regulator